MMMVVIHTEDGGASETIYVVVHSEERGGMMTEERSEMMMLAMVPTQLSTARKNHLFGYCLPSLIMNFTKITSDVCKGVLGVV